MSHPNLQLTDRITNILKNIQFGGDSFGNGQEYEFDVLLVHAGVAIQGVYTEPDVYTGKSTRQTTRKWIITPAMTDSEIVQTVFKLLMTSGEHRVREHFKYKGARVFSPHFNVEDLVHLCKDRENAGGR